jgi:hypothetical protein
MSQWLQEASDERLWEAIHQGGPNAVTAAKILLSRSLLAGKPIYYVVKSADGEWCLTKDGMVFGGRIPFKFNTREEAEEARAKTASVPPLVVEVWVG